ncbi:hypothetical protein OC835_000714 [Tilletia horrida]|nr:hypothetical protein OC835_000714 [Tilletia horrida]
MTAASGQECDALPCYMPGSGSSFQDVQEALKRFEQQRPTEWANLLRAQYVVIHCDECPARSPAMIKALQQKRLLNATEQEKKNSNGDGRRHAKQKVAVGLMHNVSSNPYLRICQIQSLEPGERRDEKV